MQPSRQQISTQAAARADSQDHDATRGLLNAALIGALCWSLLGALGWLLK